jgi:transcriptional regulator with XRE-family HTH domain
MSKGPEKEGREPDDRDPLLIAFGERVRVVRTKSGMTQRQLAAAAETTQGYIYMVESGATNLGVAVMLRLAKALGVSAADLMPPDPERAPSNSTLQRAIDAYENLTKEVIMLRTHAISIESNLSEVRPIIDQLKHILPKQKTTE